MLPPCSCCCPCCCCCSLPLSARLLLLLPASELRTALRPRALAPRLTALVAAVKRRPQQQRVRVRPERRRHMFRGRAQRRGGGAGQ
eukprot:245532-Rhodomonas_salina.2